ncbi:MAG TPA: NAD(P)-dependent alcohol dehydrogenase [Pseudonocardiaceae bacterium]|jgi:aryl-alcohol dehydrogenase|nr:NAD(P)-dependent alcohol dehydrogenase [Pseudonocardiaceae bacterium]
MRIVAAVAHEEDEPFTIEELTLDAPRSDELLVRIDAVGVCSTDIAIRDQCLPVPLPAVLGHEGAGVVEAVGSQVSKVAPGDKVVLTYGSCGRCALCAGGHPAYCLELVGRNLSGGRPDGSNALHGDGGDIHGFFFSQSSFATHAIATERNVVRLDDDVNLDIAAPLGCGIQTGAGAVMNRLRPEAGSSLAVFGLDAVGLAALLAARAVGCATIIAVDTEAARLELARELGATDTVNMSRVNPVSSITGLTGVGVCYAVVSSASPDVARQAVNSLAPLGTCALLGRGPIGTELSVTMTNLLIPGRTVTGVTEGDSRPDEFIPRLLALYQQGRFPLDQLIDTYALGDINRAIEDTESGKTIKAVLRPH